MRARTVIAAIAALAAGLAVQAADVQSPAQAFFYDTPAANSIDILMYADLAVTLNQVKGLGRVEHYVFFDREGIKRQTYRAFVTVRIPSDVPGFETLEDALEADVRIRLAAETAVDQPTVRPSPKAYIPYAECMLAIQPITSRHFVTYELLMVDHGHGLKVAKGVCDIDIASADIQVGIPQMGYLDLITGFVEYEADPDMAFMEGYCY